MILSDKQIETMGIIDPFQNSQVSSKDKVKRVSYGVSSYGYDVTAAEEFKIFTNINNVVIDPKRFDKASFVEGRVEFSWDYGAYVVIPPNSFALATTNEYIKMPRGIVGLMTVKSTYARCGIVSPPTVLEPEWEGNITIEISNTTPLPAKVYVNEGIAQVLFLKGDTECAVSYLDRQGKYQGQTGVTLPR